MLINAAMGQILDVTLYDYDEKPKKDDPLGRSATSQELQAKQHARNQSISLSNICSFISLYLSLLLVVTLFCVYKILLSSASVISSS
jgi:hypothetical protein